MKAVFFFFFFEKQIGYIRSGFARLLTFSALCVYLSYGALLDLAHSFYHFCGSNIPVEVDEKQLKMLFATHAQVHIYI